MSELDHQFFYNMELTDDFSNQYFWASNHKGKYSDIIQTFFRTTHSGCYVQNVISCLRLQNKLYFKIRRCLTCTKLYIEIVLALLSTSQLARLLKQTLAQTQSILNSVEMRHQWIDSHPLTFFLFFSFYYSKLPTFSESSSF